MRNYKHGKLDNKYLLNEQMKNLLVSGVPLNAKYIMYDTYGLPWNFLKFRLTNMESDLQYNINLKNQITNRILVLKNNVRMHKKKNLTNYVIHEHL